MGDPKFSRKIYDTPSHPWEGERIAQEKDLVKKYGLKNKRELWKAESLLRTFRHRARTLQAKVRYGDQQAEREREQLMSRLDNMGILAEDSSLDDVLSMTLEDLMARRFQTLAYLKGLSNSPKQARQFIVHGHVAINGRKVTIPGYMVKRSEEEGIGYLPHSPLADDMHPARPRDDMDMPSPVRAEPPAGDEQAQPLEEDPKGKAPTDGGVPAGKEKAQPAPAEDEAGRRAGAAPEAPVKEEKPETTGPEAPAEEGPEAEAPAEKTGEAVPSEEE